MSSNNAADKAHQKADQVADKTHQAIDKTKETADQAKDFADQAVDKTKETADKAKDIAEQEKDTIIEKLREDGVVNPEGLGMFAFGGLFLAAVPVTSWIAQPNGLLEKAVNGVCSSVAFLGSAGSMSSVAQSGKIAALGALYVTMTYAITGAGSAAGAAAGTEGGRDNNHPRAQTSSLRGLPLRLYSAHYNLMEMFPGWAISAALAQAMAPGDQTLINLLGLHVLSKVFVYYPSYVFNVGLPRTLAHVVATASVINVALRLSKKPIL